uniref:Uncharacterized protein n=1 Tax=Acrobeloides nanus TaxID=290746 RepID=A0A914E2I4_9BILA
MVRTTEGHPCPDMRYITVGQHGQIMERTSLVRQDGLKAEELDKPFDKLFEDNDRIYSMLSTCMFERYDWPKVWSPKFSSGKQKPEVEYTLRCVCNTDLCNGPNSFSSHIHQLMESR